MVSALVDPADWCRGRGRQLGSFALDLADCAQRRRGVHVVAVVPRAGAKGLQPASLGCGDSLNSLNDAFKTSNQSIS